MIFYTKKSTYQRINVYAGNSIYKIKLPTKANSTKTLIVGFLLCGFWKAIPQISIRQLFLFTVQMVKRQARWCLYTTCIYMYLDLRSSLSLLVAGKKLNQTVPVWIEFISL